MITRQDKLKNAKAFYKKNFKEQTEFTIVAKLEGKVDLLSYAETEYTKAQKDQRRLEKMENKLTESYKITDKLGKEITIKLPQRLGYLVKEPE